MRAIDLRNFMSRHKLNAEDMAALLGRGRSTVYAYLNGDQPIQPWVKRLCEAYRRGFLDLPKE